MLAARIAGRVLSRTISFGFKGALVMAIAGVFEGFVFGIAFDFVPRPHPEEMDGSQMGALLMLFLGFVTSLLVFSIAGVLTSRRNDVRSHFTKMCRSAVVGSCVGILVGTVCFTSLFAMLTWLTAGSFLPVPARSLWLSAGNIQASAFMGYLIGVPLGFILGTSLGAWRGAVNSIKHESSTRMETN